MSAHIASGQEENDTPEITDSPGRRLRVARQTRGQTLESIASELHLGAAMIESLEHDDYEALPGEVFVVGYIRKYARVLGLDPEPLVAAYHQAVPKGTRTWLLPRSAPRVQPRAGSGHPIMRVVSIGLLILLAALTFTWWRSQPPGGELPPGDTASEREALPPQMPEPDPSGPAPGIAGAEVTGASGAPPTSPMPPQAQSPIQSEETVARPAPAAMEQQPRETDTAGSGAAEDQAAARETEAAQASGADASAAASQADDEAAPSAEAGKIVMTFDGPCWVDVRDSERKNKLFGEMKKGDRHVLEGKPPYSVILGNAAAVKITVGGAAFDLSTISQGNVARFTLDPNESP